MNNVSIALDGRVTAWNTLLKTHASPKTPSEPESPEWGLFSALPSEGKQRFLESRVGSSHVLISDNPSKPTLRAKRGSLGISTYGRSQVRCAAQWMEDRHGLKNLSFLTCTLPPEVLAAYTPQTWAEVVNRFQKSLIRRLDQTGLSPLVLSVTEIQMNRWQAEQRQPPVHLHLLFHGRKTGAAWAYRPNLYQALWARACLSVWGVRSDFRASTRVEQLRSSGVSYLGKYMSKGVSASKQSCMINAPSAWYSISTKLKALIKQAVFKCSGELATKIYRYLRGSNKMLWERDIVSYSEESGFVWHMGWTGALLGRNTYWELIGDIRPISRARSPGVLTGML